MPIPDPQEKLKAYRSARSAAGLETDLTDVNVFDDPAFQRWEGGTFNAAPQPSPTPDYTPLSLPRMETPTGAAPASVSGLTAAAAPSAVGQTPISPISVPGALPSAQAGETTAGGVGALRPLGRRTPPTETMALAGLRKIY